MKLPTLASIPNLPRRSWRSIGAMCASALALAACSSSVPIERYATEQPQLDLRSYLNGHLKAHGLFRDRSGQVVRRFVVDITGTWQGPKGQETGTVDERFTYLDSERKGQTDRRVWHLKYLGESQGKGHYEGTADDVVGTAHGETLGNAFHWNYTLKLPVDKHVYDVALDDWMYLMDDHIMLNHAVMSKWGFRVGDIQIAFTKQP